MEGRKGYEGRTMNMNMKEGLGRKDYEYEGWKDYGGRTMKD